MDSIRGKVLTQIETMLFGECYEKQSRELAAALNRLALEKKSGSVVVLGPRGAGKSTLVRNCFNNVKDRIERVSLNGTLQTTDIAAVKEIARQLVLSIELDEENVDGNEASAANAFKDLLGRLRKPLAIVVDEFDRFATDRAAEKQSFLYTLLDATHNSTKPLLVIAISSRLDVMDALEKRVRSRISQTSLLLLNDWSFDDYSEFARRLLTVENGGRKATDWNESVSAVLSNKIVIELLESVYDTNRSLQKLRQYLTAVISLTDENEPRSRLSTEHFQRATDELFSIDSRQLVLKGLSDLEMSMLLVATKCAQTRRGGDEDLNFELIYKEYRESMRDENRKVADICATPKPVMLQVFDKLCAMGVFEPNKTLRSNALRQFIPIKVQIDTNTVRKFVRDGQMKSYMSAWLQ